MKEKELAQIMVDACDCSFNSFEPNYRGSILDYVQHFGDGQLNFRKFVEECSLLGYDVKDIRHTPYAIMNLENKLVIEKRSF